LLTSPSSFAVKHGWAFYEPLERDRVPLSDLLNAMFDAKADFEKGKAKNSFSVSINVDVNGFDFRELRKVVATMCSIGLTTEVLCPSKHC